MRENAKNKALAGIMPIDQAIAVVEYINTTLATIDEAKCRDLKVDYYMTDKGELLFQMSAKRRMGFK